MHEFSDYQKRNLLKNPNVEKLTEKSVIFTSDFKKKAVKKYITGKRADDIFIEAEIPIHYFQDRYCHSCIKRWKKKFLEHGENSLDLDTRGKAKSPGRPRKPTYEELEEIVKIQREALGYAKK